MTKNKNRETKASGWLHTLGNFFGNALTRIKLLFGESQKILPQATTNALVNTNRGIEEQKNTVSESPFLLILPPGIRNKFIRLGSARAEINPPLLNHAGNHSTLALLNVNNLYFWGYNNVQSALTPRDLNDLRLILKYEPSLLAYSSFVVHPEADALLKAFKQKMVADRAIMFIVRKHCNMCGRREFNATLLRGLLPVLRLKELTVYTTNSMGILTKLVLSPLSSGAGYKNFW